MAANNRTREHHFNQKNHISVFSAEHLPYTYLTENSGDGCILAVIPAHSIIIHVLLIEEVATNTNAKFNLSIGGISIVTNGQLDVNGLIGSNQLDNVHIENSGDLIFKEGSVPPTTGEFTLAVLYLEHTKHNGEYTNYSDN